MPWETVRPLLHAVKRVFHRAKLRVEQRYDLFEPLVIVPFRSWGTTRSLRVQGRVIEEKGLSRPDRESGVIRNAANTMRRLDSDEIPGAHLEISFRGKSVTTRTDDEGFFRVDVTSDIPIVPGWHRVGVKILESIAGGEGERTTAAVRVPDPNGEFIIISDIDDTVMVTKATESLEMLRNVIARNVHTREPFPGVAEFYRALVRGTSGAENAIVYVSRTGWNFYDLVVDFLDLHGIPAGPMLMQDLAIVETRAKSLATDEQKLSKISEIIEAFPDDRFVLIGDSGQADASIYAECVERFGARVAAVYIRKAGGHEVDPATAATIRSVGAALCVADATTEMARHAAAEGLIAQEAADAVIAASRKEAARR